MCYRARRVFGLCDLNAKKRISKLLAYGCLKDLISKYDNMLIKITDLNLISMILTAVLDLYVNLL